MAAEGGGSYPYFLPALSARSTAGEVRLRLKLQLIDGDRTRVVFSHDYTVGETQSRPSGGFDIGEVAPSAALALHIVRLDDRRDAGLHVDDVQVIRQR
ncbi:hypothetical protein [Luteibacter yeojuensis]